MADFDSAGGDETEGLGGGGSGDNVKQEQL